MRKVLLASTALVALGSISAHAADISISGSYATGVRTDGDNTTDESSMFSEADVNIKFSNTTDSGITSTLNYGLDESGNTPAEDLTATLSGDFGTFNFDSVGDDGALGGFDSRADMAGEGTNATRTAGTAISASDGIMGTGNMAMGYTLPSVMDGLKIAVNGSDTTAAGEYFGYGVSYDAGMFSVGYVKEASNTAENTYSGLSASFGDISIGYDKSDRDNGGAATGDRESTTMGVSYALGDITLAYETGELKDGAGTEMVTHSQIAATYTVATGVTAVITTSEVDAATAQEALGHSDVDQLELQLKLSF